MKPAKAMTAQAMHDAITAMVKAVQENRTKKPDPFVDDMLKRVSPLFDDPEENDPEDMQR